MNDFDGEMDDFSSESKEGLGDLTNLDISVIQNVVAEVENPQSSEEDGAIEEASEEDSDSSILADEDLNENDPPLKAVQGYRPNDYAASQFFVGVHLQYSTSKQGPWQEGIVVSKTQVMDATTLHLKLLGKHQPGTSVLIYWPGVFEIFIVEPLAIHKRDGDLKSLENMHVRFTYRKRWRHCGFVVRSTESVLKLQSTKLTNEGEVRDFDRTHVSDLTWVPYPKPFQFMGWTSEDGDPGQIPFTGASQIQNANYLRSLDESDLYFSLYKSESLGIDLLERLREGTNSRGAYDRSRLVKYGIWPSGGVTQQDIKEFIRLRFITDLSPGPLSEKFSKEWFGFGTKKGILGDIVYHKFKIMNALYRVHTIKDEKAKR